MIEESQSEVSTALLRHYNPVDQSGCHWDIACYYDNWDIVRYYGYWHRARYYGNWDIIRYYGYWHRARY